MLLSEIRSGKTGKVIKIIAGHALFNRLASMGLSEDTEFLIISNTGKGPILVEVKGKRFALGRNITDKIEAE